MRGSLKADSPGPGGVLFSVSGPPKPLEQALQRLQQLAGGASSRLGAHERLARETRPEQILEALQQEEAPEATSGLELEEGLQELETAQLDPMQRMMLLQMKQMQMMSKQAQPRHFDPIHQALGGAGASEAGSSGGGIKGCLAREAYEVIQRNGLEELGLDVMQPHPGLMRDWQMAGRSGSDQETNNCRVSAAAASSM